MGLLGGEAARYLLFTHHLFWIGAAMLLITPVLETLWPSSQQKKRQKRGPTSGANTRRRAKKSTRQDKPAPASETPGARLARLQKEKQAVDRHIAKLTAVEKKRVK